MMKFKIPVFIVLIGLLAIAACKKFDEAPSKVPTTFLNFINSSTDTLNVYVNGSRLNNLSSTYPLGSSGYIQSPLGEQNYQVRRFGHGDVLFSVPIKLDSAGIYSFYVTDGTVANSFTTKDTLNTLPDSVTSIRFVQTSPNLGNVDVVVTDTLKKVVNFKNRSFKSSSIFLRISAGLQHIQVYKAGTTTPLVDEERILQSRRSYTLFTRSALADGGRLTSNTGLIINSNH